MIPLNSDLGAGVSKSHFTKIEFTSISKSVIKKPLSWFILGFNTGLKFEYFYCVHIRYCIWIVNIRHVPDSADRNRAEMSGRTWSGV